MLELEVQRLEASVAREREELQRAILRAQESRSLLDNPVLEEWFRDMEAQCVSEIDVNGLTDPKLREHCVLLIVLLKKLRKSLEYYIEEGEVSKARLDELLEVKTKRLGGLFG